MKDITHIERPNLPWRSDRLTECKLDAGRHPTWTRDEAVAKARELGKQRFAMVVCMNCMNPAERHQTWDEDPASCMDRYVGPVWGSDNDESKRLECELRAIALLIEAHREEFDATVASLGSAQSLSAVRSARRYRAATWT